MEIKAVILGINRQMKRGRPFGELIIELERETGYGKCPICSDKVPNGIVKVTNGKKSISIPLVVFHSVRPKMLGPRHYINNSDLSMKDQETLIQWYEEAKRQRPPRGKHRTAFGRTSKKNKKGNK